jgi:mycothiol system anti-sigma-R factor
MMSCEDCLEKLHDYLGQELTGDILGILQRHLDDCPPCFDRFEFSIKLRRLVRDRSGDHAVPEGLQIRIMAEIQKVIPQRRKARALPMSRGQSTLGLVASLVMATGLAGSLLFLHGSGQGPAEAATDPPLLAALVQDHEACSTLSTPGGVSLQQATRQLCDGLGYAVRLPQLPSGCAVRAVRVCDVDGVHFGHVILSREGHLFSWFVARTGSLPEGSATSGPEPQTVASEALLMRVHADQTDCIVSDKAGDVKALALETGI